MRQSLLLVPTRRCVPQLLFCSALLSLLLLPAVHGRSSRNRGEMIEMLGGKEERIYFNSCNQINQVATCVFAIDNGKSQEYSQCAVTTPDFNPWWIGELETPSYITTVKLLGMLPNYLSDQDGLRNFMLMANRDVCIEYRSDKPFDTQTFGCDAFADKIHIVGKGHSVSLGICDVEVSGVVLQFPTIDGQSQLLKFKRCRQSTDFSYCDFALAPKEEPRCAYTNREVQPWMEFYLEYPAFFQRITLFHRRNDLAPSEYTIDIDDEVCDHKKYSPNGYYSQSHDCDMFGNRVKIQSWMSPPRGSLYESSLQVCKIEATGFPAAMTELDTFTPLGCYNDDLNDPDMPDLVSFTRMDVSKCYRICRRRQRKYFAVKFGKQCFCSDKYGKHGKSDESQCDIKCEANKAEMCGGNAAMNVFETGGFGGKPEDPAEAGLEAKTATDSEIKALPKDSPLTVDDGNSTINGTVTSTNTTTPTTTLTD